MQHATEAKQTTRPKSAAAADSVLGRFSDHLITHPHATNDLSAGTRPRRKVTALTQRYIALNHRLCRYLALDVDRQGGAFAWDDGNLPTPSIITVNTENGHAHLLWELLAPVATTESARKKPMEYLNAIRTAYCDAAGADRGFAGYLTKNPFHSEWRALVTDKRYDLAELAEWCDIRPRPRLVDTFAGGRNTHLFETVRQWAYRNAHNAPCSEAWLREIESHAIALNDEFSTPLPVNEVRNTARSIAKWTWARRYDFGTSHGMMKLTPMPPAMEAAERIAEVRRRQRLGADFANEQRRAKSAATIEQALTELRISEPRDRDASAVAVRAKVGVNTVRRFIKARKSDYKE